MSLETSANLQVRARRGQQGRLLFAGVASQSIEYYDFFVYGTAASLVLNTQFFPSADPVVGVLAAFATFAVGFAGRPIGAAVFGHIGDRFGRKPALLLAILIMASSTMLIGFLPGYGTIGVAAPIILALLRILQGISLGGQWAGSTLLSIEHAPANRRGLFGSLPQVGVSVGMVAGTLVFLFMGQVTTNEQFLAWGWRIPFLLTVVMFPVAYIVHRHIEDTPQFQEVEAKLNERMRAPRSSVLQVLRQPQQVLLIAFAYLPPTIMFYVVSTGLLQYAVSDLHLAKDLMLFVVMISMAAFAAGTIFFAWLSDKVGRRWLYAAGAAVTGVWGFVMFPLAETRSFALLTLAACVGMIAVGMMFGPGAALWAEMFPTGVRYSGISLGTQLANVIGGGLAPFIMVALLAATHTTVSVGAYVALGSVLSLLALAMLRAPREVAKHA
ncbi:MFS transporter [Sinomonas humi]|uniref:MFS transporter n=1 Tax=Sinomonas humi TaxID=1338436 RepID=UPI000689537C|nr:MFS transporter [Sinomonas humi]